MTNLQAEYTKILEARRHNLATEQQTDKSLEIEGRKADESARHNLETESLTLRDQQLRSDIAKLDAFTKRVMNTEKIQNEQQLKQWDLNYKQKADQLKNTLDLYKAKLQNGIESGKLALNMQKTKADIRKIDAEIQNMADKILLEYDKSWTATKTKWLRETQGALKELPDDFIAAVADKNQLAGSVVKSILHQVFWDPTAKNQGEEVKNHSILGKLQDIKDILEGAKTLVSGENHSSTGRSGMTQR